MVWTASPHNFLALAGVEAGVMGAIALLAVLFVAAARAVRRRPYVFSMLIGAAVVMALDVFSSQPVQGLLWWAVLGSALVIDPRASKPGVERRSRARGWTVFPTVAILGLGLASSARMNVPCTTGCDPLTRFAGHPGLLQPTLAQLMEDPADARWDEWRRLYPMSFWLDKAFADASLAKGDPSGYVGLIHRYPYQSVENYLVLLQVLPQEAGAAVAECGMTNFFSGQTIYRDMRSSPAELAAARQAFEDQLRVSESSGTAGNGSCAGMDSLLAH